MAIIIPAAIVVLLAVWVIATYNRLVKERLKVRTQWSQVDVVLRQRFDMLTKLVDAVKGYAAHEKDTLQAVIDARNGYLSAAGVGEQIRAGAEFSGAMGRLMALAEAYPELKADGNFLQLQQQIAAIENKLADNRQFYNDTVMRYNQQIVTIPSNIVAGLFGFKEEAFFQADDNDKASVKIEF